MLADGVAQGSPHPDEHDGQRSGSGARGPAMRVGRWAARALAGLVVAAALLGAGEGAARRWGQAPTTFPSPLPFQEMLTQPLQRIQGGVVWPWGRSRVAPSPAPGLRVQLYGESAAYGDGYTTWASMGGVLERSLRRTLGGPVDVLNLATPGVGSRQLAIMHRQALATERPDVVVLYICNNELHELRALKTVMPHYSARQELVRRRLWGSHLYRLATRALVPPPEPYVVDPRTWPTIDRLQTVADADDRALAMHFYTQNLRAMIQAAQAEGVKVVLATVAVNEAELLKREATGEQARLRDEALALRHTDPAAAAARWRAAESLAERPLAALPETWTAVRELAAEHDTTLCDVVELASAAGPNGLPATAWFDDHCHPSPQGHVVVGDALAACVLRALGESATPVSGAPPQSPAGRLDGFLGTTRVEVPDDGTASAALLRGNTAAAQGRLPEAVRAWDDAERRGADPAVLALNRGLLALLANDLPRARAQAARARELAPDDRDVADFASSLSVGSP